MRIAGGTISPDNEEDSLTIVKAVTSQTELVRQDKTSSISSFDVLSNGDFIIALKFGSFLFKLKTDGTWERFIDVKMPSSVLINSKDEIHVAHEMFVSKVVDGKLVRIVGSDATTTSYSNPLETRFVSIDSLCFGETEDEIYFTEPTRFVWKVKGNTLTKVAGGLGDGLPATEAKIQEVSSFFVSVEGEMVIADTQDHVIRKVSKEGIISTLYGIPGVSGYNTESDASKTLFNQPKDIHYTNDGDLYVFDSKNNLIRRISKGIITTIVGSKYNISTIAGGETLLSPDELPIGRPLSMDYYQNYLFVVDGMSGLIKRLSLIEGEPSKVVEVIAGVSGFVGWFESQMATQQKISPHALTVSKKSGQVYFVETFGNEIKKIDSSGRIVLVASNSRNNERCQVDSETTVENPGFLQIQDLFHSSEGSEEYLYVVETHNHWIRKIELSSGNITIVAGKCGKSGDADDSVVESNDLLTNPSSVFVKYDSKSGKTIVYITDTYNIRKVENGIVTIIAGKGVDLPVIDGYIATNVSIVPHKIFVNHNNEILFTELSFDGVRKITSEGKIFSIPSSKITLPYSLIQFENSADIYVASVQSNIIFKIDGNGQVTNSFGNGEKFYFGNGKPAIQSQSTPHHIHVTSKNGRDIVTLVDHLEYPKIRTIANSIITHTLGVKSAISTHKYLDDLPLNKVKLENHPNIMAQRVGNDVYFTQDDTIYKFSSATGKVIRVAGTRHHYYGDGSLATSALLYHPLSVFYSNQLEMVLIADTKNQRIRAINKKGIISTLVGMDSSAIINTFIEEPLAIFERNGLIYFSTGSEVKKVNIEEKKMETVLGSGVTGVSDIRNRTATDIQLDFPEGLYVTEDDKLYVADANNNRILKVVGDMVEIVTQGADYFIRPSSIAVNSKEEIYMTDMLDGKVKRISPNGNISTVFEVYGPQHLILSKSDDIYVTHLPGSLSKFSEGKLTLLVGNITVSANDLSDPTRFHFTFLNGLSFGETEQDILFTEPKKGLIRKLSNGLVKTIGGGIGDGLPANQALLYDPGSFIVTPEDEILIADSGHHVIRKVSKNGIMSTLYGIPGVHGYNDETDASKALLNSPTHMSLTKNGDLFFVDQRNFIIRKISKGIISTVIGKPHQHSFIREGSKGKDTLLSYPASILANDQYVLFTEHSSSGIFKLLWREENAIVERIAGFDFGYNGDGDAKPTRLTFSRSLSFSSDGLSVYFTDDESDRIRMLTPYCSNSDYKVSDTMQACVLTPIVNPLPVYSPQVQASSGHSYILALVSISLISFSVLLVTLIGTVYHIRKNTKNYHHTLENGETPQSNFH
ncbi:predicted protein [Naegleria gruberi]|uniref:Predicted protein n=1 Tax=Naegleria gruberi TaxID=5762 RepID=D2VDA4_NAEGR|nr:uncharacterized protein NAEGRDRAFT_48564 [Naegleria gruberi]EFC45199.1 predicted protein [Naegleria gruberi]|eukprot:XP_002677943.1 predicted protein [Naegleria gruberi strain NEG-M]